MQKAVAKEGPCAPLFCLGVVILLAASGTAAQTVEQSDLERCASLATSELKLACFEALTAIEGGDAEPAANTTPQPQPDFTLTEKTLTSAAAAAGVAGSDAGLVAPAQAAAASDVRADVTDDTGRALTDEEQVDVADELGRELPDEEQVELVDEIGREHLDEKKVDKEEETVIRATVSEVVKGSFDVLYFHFTNGQVWRQVESRRFRYPRAGEFEVIISRGMMGDYRLRLDENNPMTRIRRIR